MGLFSFFRKNKQEPATGDREFYSRPDEESAAVRGRGRRKDNKANDAVDPVLPEKKRARRRLVGAIALVLAAVIGLPMIFDSEPKPVADDITIQIPPKDKPAATGSDTNPSAPATSTSAASASLDPKEEVVKTSNSSAGGATALNAGGAVIAAVARNSENDKQSVSAKSPIADKSNAEAHRPESKPELKQVEKASAKVDKRVEAKPAASVAQKLNDAHKSKDKVKNSGASSEVGKSNTEKNSGKFMLQVAALMTKEKINDLQGKLKKAGFTTSSQKVATEAGVSTRIRVGPYSTKEEAEKARSKLVKMGLNGTLVSR
jgi:DedD protein